MADFTFGQVETVLSWINDIADHKRTAFVGRLKHLQKNGIPTRDRPGRGKAGTFNFCQLVQFAIGLEFIQSGMPPQMAARLVAGNWSVLRHTAYLSSWRESEYKDGTTHLGRESDFTANWAWLVTPEALKDLSKDGVHEWDHMEAVRAVPLGEVSHHLDTLNEFPTFHRPRTLVLYASKLIRDVMNVLEWTFRWSTAEEMRADLLAEIAADQERLERAIELIDLKAPLNLSEAQRETMKASIRAWADYETAADAPTADALALGRALMPELSEELRSLLLEVTAGIPTGLILTADNKRVLLEMVDRGLIDVREAQDLGADEVGVVMTPTRIAEAVAALLKEEASNVSPKA